MVFVRSEVFIIMLSYFSLVLVIFTALLSRLVSCDSFGVDIGLSSNSTFADSSSPITSPSFAEEYKNTSSSNVTDIIIKMMSHKCSKTYSMTCFKLDMVRLVDRFGSLPSYQLFPGVSLVHVYPNDSVFKELPVSLINALAQGNISNELDEFLARHINNYLNSFLLSVKLLDHSTITKAKEIGEDILNGFSKDVQKGRKKGYGGALWAAGTIATLGMAALAAMAGKAMMTSMLALMLAAAGALRGGAGAGGGDKCAPHYITAHGRNMDMQELMQKPIELSGTMYRTVLEREP